MTGSEREIISELTADGYLDAGDIDLVLTGLGIEYLAEIPDSVPADFILVHNHVSPRAKLGENGFRAWLHGPSPNLRRHEICDCGWAPQLPEHYRVIR